jgi:hypothetical protein
MSDDPKFDRAAALELIDSLSADLTHLKEMVERLSPAAYTPYSQMR